MKKAIYLIAAVLLSLNAIAGNGDSKNQTDKYCCKIKDGIPCIIHDGAIMTSEITLSNGTIVKSNGTLIKKDGSTSILKEGECIDNDGKITEENPKEKKEKKSGINK